MYNKIKNKKTMIVNPSISFSPALYSFYMYMESVIPL